MTLTHVEVGERSDRVLNEIERAVIGKRDVLELILLGLLCDGHVLIDDVPGLAKTLMARSFASVTGLGFGRIQFTPDLVPSDITGSTIYDQHRGEFSFRPGPVFTNVLLGDEINRAPAKTQAALLEAMEERQVTIEGTTHPLPRPFLVLATQNPIEFEGTFALPQAQLDRFLVRVRLGYPEEAAERSIARRHQAAAEPLDTIEPVIDGPALLALRDEVRTVHVSDEVEGYLVALVRATRAHHDLQLGASPRSSVALYRAAQATALLAGRRFALPDDVQAIARPVLAHRLVVDLDESLRGASADGALGQILQAVPVPPIAGR